LDVITLKSRGGCSGGCAEFLDHFFELPGLCAKPSKSEVLHFEVRKDAFLAEVASVHATTRGDLRKEMTEALWRMREGRPTEGSRQTEGSPPRPKRASEK
jgi:hypothetical protein